MSSALHQPATADRLPPWVEPPNSLRCKSERGEVAVWFPAPLVIVYKYKGVPDVALANFIGKAFDDHFGPDQRGIHLFSDTEEQTGYDPEFRRVTGARALRVEPRTDTYCLLVTSRIIAFGIHLCAFISGAPRASGLSGRMTAISNRDAFRAKIEAAVRKTTKPPAA